MKRGFTLLEVVAATVLLTMIVAAGIPFLRSARADLQAAASPIGEADRAEIESSIDDLLRQRPGLVTECLAQPAGLPVEWTGDERVFNTNVRLTPVVRADEDEHRSTHTWAVIVVNGTEVIRWMRVPLRVLDGGNTP